MKRKVCISALMGLIFAALCSGQETSTQPSGAAAELLRMRALVGGSPGGASRDEFIETLKQRLPAALAVLDGMEQKYPKAEELHEARMMGVVAAVQMARINNDPAGVDRVKEIVSRIASSDAPGQIKLQADAHLLLLTLKPIVAATTEPATRPEPVDTSKAIMQFTQRYAKTDQAVNAIATGMQIAGLVDNKKVFDELLEKLMKEYSSDPQARGILRQLGKGSDVGGEFTATLTRLDGTKLTLPDDLLGKVVVIDFWATWCGPCIQAIPHLKSFYAEYKSRGVEIVGISLDQDQQKLKTYIATNKLDWIITYSGQGWKDPTARQYGINGIPSVWVIGKDGKVVSDNARGSLEETVEKALSASTTATPSTTSAPADK